MNGALRPFLFEGETIVRARRDEKGQIWFVAADVCAVLEIKNSRDALSNLDSDEIGVATSYTNKGAREVATVNESGTYALILRSRKPNARQLRKWVTSEVLPTLRRDGTYTMAAAAGAVAGDPSQMPLDTDPFIAEIKARRFKPEVVGAYVTVIVAIWIVRGPIADDKRAIGRLIGCTAARWLKYRAALGDLLTCRDGYISHERTERTLRERGLWIEPPAPEQAALPL